MQGTRHDEVKRGKTERETDRKGQIDWVASLQRSKRESRWPKRAAIYAARRKSKAQTEAPLRRSSVDQEKGRDEARRREKGFLNREGRTNRTSGRDERLLRECEVERW